MVKLIREKRTGGAWETVVDTGGSGGSQNLAEVLSRILAEAQRDEALAKLAEAQAKTEESAE